MTNIEELKSTGLKATLPRLKILEVFQQGSQRHMTAEDVFRVLLEERSDIGLATVYRGLQWLVDAGLVDSIRNSEGETTYRRCSPVHHHHLICRRCGRAVEVAGEPLEVWSRQVAAEHGFREPEHFVEVYGICSSC